MEADLSHHRMELSMQRMGNKIYDFEDFITCVKQACLHTKIFVMDLKHFFEWQDYTSA